MEYLDDQALNIYTDGSSLRRPRRGGVGIVFVTVDGAGREQIDEYPMPGYPGGTNQEMELQAPIDALSAIVRGQAPVDPSRFKKVVIWTDSQYVTENIRHALHAWPANDWMTRDGNPVVNARLWKELTRLVWRTQRRVDFQWVKGHKHSPHNKRADKLAKQSARACGPLAVSRSAVRRKITSRLTEPGSVAMLGQRMTIRIVTDRFLEVQGMNRYRYEVVSRNSPFRSYLDWIYTEREVVLEAGHTYYVRVNDETRRPRIVKVYREVGPRK